MNEIDPIARSNGAGHKPSMAASDDQLWASVDGIAASLSNDECMFQHRLSGDTHVMTTDVLAAMNLCRTFQPIATHINTIEQQIPALKGQAQAIARVLDFLADRGLIESAEQIFARSSQPCSAPVDTSMIAVRTCDRPEQLGRLLDSLQAYQSANAVTRPITVFDDSRQADHAQRNAELVGKAAESGLAVAYRDRTWRDIVALTAAAELSLDVAQIAKLIGGTTISSDFSGGQVWNAILLATAGQGTFMLDDDFVLDFRQRPAAHQLFRFASEQEKPVTFAASTDRLAAELTATKADVFSSAASLTGAGLDAALTDPEFAEPAALRGMAWTSVNRLFHRSTIKTTAVGTWGDGGMDTNLWFYLMPKQWLSGWWESREVYFSLLQRPVIAHGFDHRQVTEFSPMLPFSIDNSSLTPATMPHGRGEDLFFAAALRYLYPRSVAINLPTMVGHQRPLSDKSSEQPHALQPPLSRLIAEYLLSKADQCEASEPEQRFQFMTGMIADLGNSSASRRRVILREFLSRIRADVVAQIQQTLASAPEAPGYFQADARDWLEANGRALTQPDMLRLADCPDELSIDEHVAQLGDDLVGLAESMKVWPKLWNWAAQRGGLADLGD